MTPQTNQVVPGWRLEFNADNAAVIAEKKGFGGCLVENAKETSIAQEVLYELVKDLLAAAPQQTSVGDELVLAYGSKSDWGEHLDGVITAKHSEVADPEHKHYPIALSARRAKAQPAQRQGTPEGYISIDAYHGAMDRARLAESRLKAAETELADLRPTNANLVRELMEVYNGKTFMGEPALRNSAAPQQPVGDELADCVDTQIVFLKFYLERGAGKVYVRDAIHALEKALSAHRAQPAQQQGEPVAWISHDMVAGHKCVRANVAAEGVDLPDGTLLYTQPPTADAIRNAALDEAMNKAQYLKPEIHLSKGEKHVFDDAVIQYRRAIKSLKKPTDYVVMSRTELGELLLEVAESTIRQAQATLPPDVLDLDSIVSRVMEGK
jgi:hypothetical protein